MSRSLVSNMRLVAIAVISIFGGLLKVHAADNQLSIKNLILLPGETRKIAVDLSNSDPCYGLQFDLSLPEGLTLTGVDKTTRTGDCVLTPNLNAGKERVVLLSLPNALADNSGEICELNVQASDSFIGGNLKISNIKMADGGTSDIVLPNVQNSFSTLSSAALTMPERSIIAGEYADVHVGLNSVGNVAGLQFDMYLTASLAVDLDSFALSSDISGFTIDKQQHSEFVRVLIYSLNRSVLTGDISDLFSFTVNANEGVQGAPQIKLQSVAASTQSGVSVPLNDVSTNFTITPKITSISLSSTNVTLKVGEDEQFTATVLPTEAADKSVSWSVSDSNVVTVDETGLVHAVGIGTATLTATSNENPDVSATAQITVIENPSGIDSPVYSEEADSTENVMVFTTNGLYVAKTTDNLLPGVYIVKSVSAGVTSTKKIVVK